MMGVMVAMATVEIGGAVGSSRGSRRTGVVAAGGDADGERDGVEGRGDDTGELGNEAVEADENEVCDKCCKLSDWRARGSVSSTVATTGGSATPERVSQ
jgi:hypothetical protein